LTALANATLNNNFNLKAAAARVDAAREQARIAGAERWPQLGFATGYLRNSTGTGILNSSIESTDFGAFEALFTLRWEIDVWGRIKASQQAFQQ
jgi:multidrug efflux system outer membrane protein